jgi:hypothetical protein
MNAAATTFARTDTARRGPYPRFSPVGAAGASAGTVIPELAKRGAYVRGLIHEPKQTVARNQGAAETAVRGLACTGEH